MPSRQQLMEVWRKNRIDEKLLTAFARVPRELFVPRALQEYAYHDHPLPTFRNQSISQPTTVMLMLQALDLKAGEKVLEVGTGGGYQAAMLSLIVGEQGKVITTEVIPELVQIAKINLANLSIQNVRVIEADGSIGFPSESAFDKAIITAACPAIPQPIIDQLKEGGIVVAPVGDINEQIMAKGIKVNGKLEFEFMGPFRFVPLRGKYGFEEK